MKKKTQAQLRKKLWEVFAKYVKERDNWTCVTCGKHVRGAGMGAGHYIAKSACGLDYYFSEFNVHAQCSSCNCFLGGNHPAYRKFILEKYGEKVLNDIEFNFRKPCKDFPFQEKIVHYTNLLSELNKT